MNLKKFKKLEKDFIKKQKAFQDAKAKMLEFYSSSNEETIDGNFVKIFTQSSFVRESIDKKLLKEKHPRIYSKMLKSTPVKGSIKIKVIK